MGDLMDEYDTKKLTECIVKYLEKNMLPSIKNYFDDKQKTHGTFDSLEYHEYQDKLILRSSSHVPWFREKFPYQPMPDISVVPTKIIKWKASEREGDFAPVHALEGLFKICEIKCLINQIWRMSDNYRFVIRDPSDIDNIIDPQFDPKSNKTPQCFISMELEKSKHMKYVLGSAFNASITGQIGMLIYDHDNSRDVAGLYEIIRRKKMLRNVIFISHQDLLRVIECSGSPSEN